MENWFKIEFVCLYKLHLKPWELDQMEFYRIEYMLKNYDAQIKKENEEHEKQRRAQEKQSKTSSPKQPKMSGYKPPKINIPKFPTK